MPDEIWVDPNTRMADRSGPEKALRDLAKISAVLTEQREHLHWLREQILKAISDHRPGSYAPVDVFSDGELIECLRKDMGLL